jgi:hypothetical protein
MMSEVICFRESSPVRKLANVSVIRSLALLDSPLYESILQGRSDAEYTCGKNYSNILWSQSGQLVHSTAPPHKKLRVWWQSFSLENFLSIR